MGQATLKSIRLKNITKYEKKIMKLSHEEQELRSQLKSVAYNYEALLELTQKIDKIWELKIAIEDDWINTSAELEK